MKAEVQAQDLSMTMASVITNSQATFTPATQRVHSNCNEPLTIAHSSNPVENELPSVVSIPTSNTRSDAHLPRTPSLYVGDLHRDVTESDLVDAFQAHGPIHSVKVCRDLVTRRSLGYGYVNFESLVDAEHALNTMNYYAAPQTKGKPMRLMWKLRDPSMRRSGPGNIFVKGLDSRIDCKAMYDTFSQFGNILSCKLATTDDGESLGHGFVHFESVSDAEETIRNVNGMKLEGKKVFVGPFKTRREREATGTVNKTFTNVYVKHLGRGMCEEQALRDLFSDYGKITSVYVPHDQNGDAKGYAFLNFAKPENARLAVEEMNGKRMNGGCTLYVNRAQKRSERTLHLQRAHARAREELEEKRAGKNLYIKNLSPQVDELQLEKHFQRFGTITSRIIMRDAQGTSRGFGFVCYSESHEAKNALTLNGSTLEERQLFVAMAQKKEERRARLVRQRSQARPLMSSWCAMFAQSMRYQPSPNAIGSPSIPMMHNHAFPPLPPIPRALPHPAVPVYLRTPNILLRALSPVPPVVNAPISRTNPKARADLCAPAVDTCVGDGDRKLTAQLLANASSKKRNDLVGMRLYPEVSARSPKNAAKITGMLLELDDLDLLHLLCHPHDLNLSVDEAEKALREHAVKEKNVKADK